jgi:hypothetical protein
VARIRLPLGTASLNLESHGPDLSQRLDAELRRIKDTDVLTVEARLNPQTPGAGAVVFPDDRATPGRACHASLGRLLAGVGARPHR